MANTLYSIIDTDRNLFAPFTGELYPMLLRYSAHNPRGFERYFVEALQKRIGTTKYTTYKDIVSYIHTSLDKTINDILVMPEQDGWVYSHGEQLGSSGFVA